MTQVNTVNRHEWESIVIATQHGFAFSHICKICKNKYNVYLNPELPDIEMKIKIANGYTRIFRSGAQIAYCNSYTLDDVLNKLFPKTVTA